MTEKARDKRHYHRGDGKVLIALASGQSIRRAARSAGVNESTVCRRLNDPDFRAELDRARSRMVDAAVGRLARSMSAAAMTLRKLLNATSEMVRLSAARSIIELHTKIRESAELERRLSELEERSKR